MIQCFSPLAFKLIFKWWISFAYFETSFSEIINYKSSFINGFRVIQIEVRLFVIFKGLFYFFYVVKFINVRLLILFHCHFNGWRFVAISLFYSWYWWFLSSPFITLSVLLEVYQFYWFFWRIRFLFHWFSFCFIVYLFSVSQSFLCWRSCLQDRKSSFSLSFSVLFLVSPAHLFFIPSVLKEGSILLSKVKHPLPSFASVFFSGVVPPSVSALSSSSFLAHKFVLTSIPQ